MHPVGVLPVLDDGAERSGGDLYSLSLKRKEIDSFVSGSLSERQTISEIEVRDRQGKLVYKFGGFIRRPETGPGRAPEVPSPHAARLLDITRYS